MERDTSRRDLIIKAGLIGVAGCLPGISLAGIHREKPPRRRVLRVAHFTDPHISPTGPSARWLGQALEHANSLKDPPSMLFFGGDMVFDGNAVDKDHMAAQWKAFHSTLRNHNDLPVRYCIGNHDVWGWFAPFVQTSEPEYGKQWVKDTLQLDSSYYSFDHAGWHFAVLDSISRHKRGYIGSLGVEQIAWLDADLGTHAGMPTMVMSHIPLLSAAAHFVGHSEFSESRWQIPGAIMHIDGRQTKDLFVKHKNVKLCASGHIHLADKVHYNGVGYVSSGAISGNWWKGNFQETPPGYGIIDLYDDGTWHHEYVSYGWTSPT